jgi:CRISPR-associated protein Csx17
MTEIMLGGCTSTPLANYLKALGILRAISDADPDARGAWRSVSFVVWSSWTQQDLERFLLHDYRPTPVMAPWNGGSGFYPRDNKTALHAIQASTAPRFALYRECLRLADQALRGMSRSESPKDEAKKALLLKLRGLLPDAALDWLDAVVLLTTDSVSYPPLLGTGGNDGRLDFTNNFMQRLGDVLSLADGAPPAESSQWLRASLYGEPAPGLLKKAVGQFSPAQVGGPNATTAFEAGSLTNPWDFVLMIEGALSFAAAAVRRSADDPAGVLSFPFTVRAVAAGAGHLGVSDAESSRGELWMPLWSKPASYPEIRTLLSEGRVAFGRRPARDALDFVRAVHQLGTWRGIQSFERYGLLMRSGKAFLAAPLARVQVEATARGGWLAELDQQRWLSRFRRFTQGENVAQRFLTLRRKLDDAIFVLSGRDPSAADVQALLILLGELAKALSLSKKAREAVPPIPRLSEQWVRMADDSMPAFRIARALAGLRGTPGTPLPLLAQLLPVHPSHQAWMTPEYRGKHAAMDAACRVRLQSEAGGNLLQILIALLNDRLRLAEQLGMRDASDGCSTGKPLQSTAGIGIGDLLQFLRDDQMDRRIMPPLLGLCLCRVPSDSEYTAGGGAVPAAFALLKLALTPDATLRGLQLLKPEKSLPVPPGLVTQLAANNIGTRAVRTAWRRLAASGLSPAMPHDALPELGDISTQRAAAALLIPLHTDAVRVMSRIALRNDGAGTNPLRHRLPAPSSSNQTTRDAT